MSQLKNQLRKLLPEIASEAKSLTKPRARQRYGNLRLIAFSGQTVKVRFFHISFVRHQGEY